MFKQRVYTHCYMERVRGDDTYGGAHLNCHVRTSYNQTMYKKYIFVLNECLTCQYSPVKCIIFTPACTCFL